MDKDKRGIGDNSIEEESYQSFADTVKDISDKLWNVRKLINEAKDTHTASHGDKYYFKDELRCAAESAHFYEANGLKSTGVERRPNPYEKKEFAGATTNTLADAAEETINLVTKLGNLKNNLKVNGKIGKEEHA